MNKLTIRRNLPQGKPLPAMAELRERSRNEPPGRSVKPDKWFNISADRANELVDLLSAVEKVGRFLHPRLID